MVLKEGVSGRDSELRFRSRSEHTLDAKGRLNIPTRFREVLRRKYSEKLIVTNWKKSLRAYPVVVWRKLEDTLVNEAPKHLGMSDFVRYVISGVSECTLDKQGRILLPGSLRAEFNIENEVVLNGMLDHFEIWDKSAWIAQTRETRANFQDFEVGLSSLGIL
ncbi:MAG: division/cell wall cluster transcriptional repressor MraZ [Desulfobulbaceae bacterium]|jgi:MraZ protein|nr:division/cell wall cluster transcriptional repressor MraZ [Desulfobulbaceae bacterium]